MEESPLFSVIIPTYNRADLLGATLESIINQEYKYWECLVIDDGSSDFTKELMTFYVEKDERIRCIERPENLIKGANSCRNYGYDLCRGSFVLWFDSDDVMLPGYLEEGRIALSNSDIHLFICSGYFTDSQLDNRTPMSLDLNIELFKDYVIWNQQIITNSVIFKNSFLKDKKLFDTRLTRGQEAELFSRIFFSISKEQYFISSRKLFLYRQHNGTKTSENLNYNKLNKESEAIFLIENLNRAMCLNDLDLLNNLYKRLIELFFLGIHNSHYANSKYVINNMSRIFLGKKFFLAIEHFVLGNLLIHCKRSSYKIEKKWNNRII
ncbi:Glycosyltransferase involved in cell wall bisynthesis [Salegentibacter agarivorans]|uniref:Glycosyltransferase involved in cell wall bisynthesis n=1 Tax=Salegentibacter agarivorans TaxID=345907 RepID=A0A1I2L7D0_9FLAO|nr:MULTISPECIES: glycosyltransferase family 2 protein [Salegentibacter]APS38799.1 hypothetical protein AO058_07875 [Salegentibacter sp. T436]SFF74389.1 Glycosyltransferase involved in cell wall bisynthesis [Salegentibacter agarivorans]